MFMEQEVWYVNLNGCYDKQLLQQYVIMAKKHNIKKMIVLEKDVQFIEFSCMYDELYHTYPQQKQIFTNKHLCSIQTYCDFITEMKHIDTNNIVRFGISIQYLPQYEQYIKKVIENTNFDVVFGEILCIDNMVFDVEELSNHMLWKKYSHTFLYRRYFELVYAMITSQLFDGMIGLDRIYQVGYSMPKDIERLYTKISRKLMMQHMAVYAYNQDIIDERLEKIFSYYKVVTYRMVNMTYNLENG